MPEHTIAENLTRLQNAKTAIGNAITAKGGTVAASDGLEEFAGDIATITNQYTSSDEGKVVSGGELVAQNTGKSVTSNGTGIDTTYYSSVNVSVPNSYSSSDEGKVVQNSALVAQTAYPTTITDNGTYDTTLNNQVSVNVAGASSPLTFVQILPVSATISSSDLYISNCGSYTCVCGHLLITVSSISFTGYTATFSYPKTFSPTHTTRKTATTYDVTSESYETGLNITINTSDKSCTIRLGTLTSDKTFDLYITALFT